MAKRTQGIPGTRKKRKIAKAAKAVQTLPIIHADTAGVDIGATTNLCGGAGGP